MNTVNSITVTIPNPTPGQLSALAEILASAIADDTGKTSQSPKRAKPPKTVSEDEDESFGSKGALAEDDLEEESVEDNTSSEDDDEDKELSSDEGAESEDDEEEESSVSWGEVTDALNEYGEKHPDEAKAILRALKVKSTKDLKTKKGLWESVYRKCKAKLKVLKKGK